MTVDMVNHPPHYKQGGIEVIDITRYLSFDIGNAIKYILRHPFKNSPKQDLEKALWYLNDHVTHHGIRYDMPRVSKVLLDKTIESLPDSETQSWDELDIVLMEISQGFIEIAALRLNNYIAQNYA